MSGPLANRTSRGTFVPNFGGPQKTRFRELEPATMRDRRGLTSLTILSRKAFLCDTYLGSEVRSKWKHLFSLLFFGFGAFCGLGKKVESLE